MNGKNMHSAETVFVLFLFGLFAICSLFLVLIGTGAYRGIVNQSDSNNEIRSSLSYIANKVRAADRGKVNLQVLDGRQVLVITSDYDGSSYRTYIYDYDGSIKEQFTKDSNSFTLGDGDKITDISGFHMTQTGRTLNLSATGKDHRTFTLSLFLT